MASKMASSISDKNAKAMNIVSRCRPEYIFVSRFRFVVRVVVVVLIGTMPAHAQIKDLSPPSVYGVSLPPISLAAVVALLSLYALIESEGLREKSGQQTSKGKRMRISLGALSMLLALAIWILGYICQPSKNLYDFAVFFTEGVATGIIAPFLIAACNLLIGVLCGSKLRRTSESPGGPLEIKEFITVVGSLVGIAAGLLAIAKNI